MQAGGATKGRYLRSAAFVLAVLLAAPECADAATYFWGGPTGSVVMPPPAMRKRSKTPKHLPADAQNEKNKPEGPLVITISIQHQRLRVYDVNGFYAEAPVSTGTAGHPTPMGVFSIIEKQRWHRSNIYSGAPMPFMQRITWSGVAMHQGILPGYPASHGCIRMPEAFAVKLWAWTKRGARVIIVPGEISPADFSHPKLIAKMLEEPVVKVAAPWQIRAAVTGRPATATPSLTLANSVAQNTGEARGDIKVAIRADVSSDSAAPVKTETGATDRRDTAGASSGKSETTGPDTTTAATSTAPSDTLTEGTSPLKVEQSIDEVAKAAARAWLDSVPATAKAEPMPAQSDLALRGAQEEHATESDGAAQSKSGQTDRATVANETTAITAEAAPASPAVSTSATVFASAAPKSEPTPAVAATEGAAAPADAAPPSYDLNDIPTVIGPKRTGHVAVFISRKERRLYVRQNFSPLFDAPVTIADPDKPMGTFVFTARGDSNDAHALHWSVVSMPIVNRRTLAQAPVGHHGKRAKPVVETTLTASSTTAAAEALERITVPDWALERVAQMIKPGGSIVISDQGLGDETGEGTDFIVALR